MSDESFEDLFRIRRSACMRPLVAVECICCHRLSAVYREQARCYCRPGCGRLIWKKP